MNPINIFIAYSIEDQTFRDELSKFLMPMQNDNRIILLDRSIIEAGQYIETVIKDYMDKSPISLIMLSPDSVGSPDFHTKAINPLLERHNKGESIVVPIILRTNPWEETSLGGLAALPKGGKPIATWPLAEEAWKDVGKGVERLVKSLEERYNQFVGAVKLADQYVETRNWAKAQQPLEEAIKLYCPGYRPELVEIKQKLADILESKKLEKEKTDFLDRERNFLKIASKADMFFEAQKWGNAKAAYQEALLAYDPDFDANPSVFRQRIADCEAALLFESRPKQTNENPKGQKPHRTEVDIWAQLKTWITKHKIIKKSAWLLSITGLVLLYYFVQVYPSRVKPHNSLRDLRIYRDNYPNGTWANYVKNNIDSLEAEREKLIGGAVALHEIDSIMKTDPIPSAPQNEHHCDWLKDALKIDPDSEKAKKLSILYHCPP